MKRKDNNSGFFLFWRGAIMQLKITTDYAIRIVYYLACRGEVITASELAYELKIPESYIPKITKKLKEANIITACEGIKTELVENEIIRYLPREPIFLQTNQIVYIHRETERETGLEFRKKLEKLQKTIQEFLVNRGVEIDFLIGIGKTVTGYHELKESFKSSKIALKYIKVIRRIIGDEDKSVIDSTKVGFFYQILEKMKDINQLQAFIPESLNKLRQYDIQKNGELVDTLECYLNVNQSLKKTSELMFIHYRTVSYRLQKIIEITNIDFNNPAEVLSVRIGLIAIRVLEVM